MYPQHAPNIPPIWPEWAKVAGRVTARHAPVWLAVLALRAACGRPICGLRPPNMRPTAALHAAATAAAAGSKGVRYPRGPAADYPTLSSRICGVRQAFARVPKRPPQTSLKLANHGSVARNLTTTWSSLRSAPAKPNQRL